ncbi:MAG TPA: Asp-tRNA(Asn)/Glu-tRNA(Gln) amidotransferase subunit GatB [Candidatus Omnitrophica bacterium]|nr:Asp-tRNA(Asn)/Glu-tRNA(Gln) amidotransferase subunit GatB [Candidatus Omnitrophota bacterium]
MNYESSIGLEIHIHLSTRTKIFCPCPTDYGKAANTQTCPVCLGLPGTLPVLNEKAFQFSIKAAIALNCKISEFIAFDRKNYYYPDLPKNYQISQYAYPVGKNGFLQINNKTVRINRIHMEEDAGKLIHSEDGKNSFIDYNRAGIPLIEIVTEPDIHSAEDAYDFLQELKTTIIYLEISDCNMEEGSLRCDANISIAEKGSKKLGTKIELKNMNSFRGLKQALEYEIQRQIIMLENNEQITHQTRLWDEAKQITTAMRSKEEAHDYRYFPDPDLVKYELSKDLICKIKKEIPELPAAKRERFQKQYNLNEYDTNLLIKDMNVAQYFELVLKEYQDPKSACNFITSDLIGTANALGISFQKIKQNIPPKNCAAILNMKKSGKISIKIAKDLLPDLAKNGLDPEKLIQSQGLYQINKTSEIESILDQILSENIKAVEDYRKGKKEAAKFLIGQAMKATKGKANPETLNRLLSKKLKQEV